ncbi:energy coupling factor transporter S component ThiW [Vallitalea okinawensis]|uniref:energy coupling factor transporter S component ThiW n=1 Tax=Vallitalea okinawensis TaxID=2078660 RepID=UPI000CFB2374|nr:energy coupling factor transporter S component ThiW [Vallitalea okinawensis]
MQVNTRKITISALFIAIGVALSQLYIPIGVSKCFPIQHFINVISAIFLGPFYAVLNAFLISLIRNLLGMGSLLAFPGSMVGALLAGIFHHYFKNMYITAIGEIIGTGLLGALIAIPIANIFMGSSYGAFFFIPPFIISTVAGSLIAIIVMKCIPVKKINELKRYELK